ncbi:MAG: hypothetical protein U0939_22270 [Pirellulales bacterium]
MKISWGHVGVSVVAMALLAGAYRVSPAVRTTVAMQGRDWFGWTEEARRADPAGFTRHVEQKLKAEAALLKKCRFELVGNADQLSGKVREQLVLRDQAQKLTEEFRQRFQEARQQSAFPIVVRNAAYTEEQAVAQVSLLLAEAEGFEKSLQRLQRIQDESNQRVREIVVRLNATETQLAAIGTQRELLESRELTAVGEELIAQVDALFNVNERVLRDNPVRSVAELMADESRGTSPALASQEAARRFLEEIPVQAGQPTGVDAVSTSTKREVPLSKEPTTTSAQEESALVIEFETTPTAETAIQQQQSGPTPTAELTKAE